MNPSSANVGRQTNINAAPPSAGRELLADAPSADDQKVALFTTLFERKSATTLWEKITHTLMTPLRRYWARQQVAEVLEYANKHEITKNLGAINTLRTEFEQGGKIKEQSARNAAIEMMLRGVMPDKTWRETLVPHLKELETWCKNLQREGKPVFSNDPPKTAALQGLDILLDFARNPGCAVSDVENQYVWEFVKEIMGIDLDYNDAHVMALNEHISTIKLYYDKALKDPARKVENSSGRLQTPAQKRETDKRVRESLKRLWGDELLKNKRYAVHMFIKFSREFSARRNTLNHLWKNDTDLKSFLETFPDIFTHKVANQRSQSFDNLLPLVIAAKDIQTDISYLNTLKQQVEKNDAIKFFDLLEEAGVSPACRLALIEYIKRNDNPENNGLDADLYMHLHYLVQQLNIVEDARPATEIAAIDKTTHHLGQKITIDLGEILPLQREAVKNLISKIEDDLAYFDSHSTKFDTANQLLDTL